MARPATARLKFNPPLGNMPALQYLLPAQLQIDSTYQRSLDSAKSQTLIRRIAQHWNWDLCQPLVVARRDNGDLYVIDGQHRLEAARLRGDIHQLPAVVVQYSSQADEAASFVHLNQQRRPLTKIDLFKAAVASEDEEACAILAAIEEAGLSIAPHQNYISWKPGMVSNIGGIEESWRDHGEKVTSAALRVMAEAFGGQVLRYAGTIFPGIAAVCADEMGKNGRIADARCERLQTMLAIRKQEDWRGEAMKVRVEYPGLRFSASSALAIRRAWAKANGDGGKPMPPPVAAERRVPKGDRRFRDNWPPTGAVFAASGKAWCEQCDMRVTRAEFEGCKSRFCSLGRAA